MSTLLQADFDSDDEDFNWDEIEVRKPMVSLSALRSPVEQKARGLSVKNDLKTLIKLRQEKELENAAKKKNRRKVVIHASDTPDSSFHGSSLELTNSNTLHSIDHDTHALLMHDSKRHKQITSCVIHPSSPLRRYWDMAILLMLVYLVVALPLRVGLLDKGDENEINFADIGIDCFFVLDIFLSFFTAYYDKFNNLVVDHEKIAENYIKGWFALDVLSTFPFYLVFRSSLNRLQAFAKLPRLVKLLRLVRLLRLFRARRFSQYLQVLESTPSVHPGLFRIIKLLILVFLFTHFTACMWFFLGDFQGDDEFSWINRVWADDPVKLFSVGSQYMTSVYWCITTLTTVGYGDITAHTNAEMVFTVIMMLTGTVFLSYTTAAVASMLNSQDEKDTEYRQKMAMLREFSAGFKIEKRLHNRLTNLMSGIWRKPIATLSDWQNLLFEFPSYLRKLVVLNMYADMLPISPFLKQFVHDDAFMAEILPRFEPIQRQRGDYIAHGSEPVDYWYVIQSGEICAVSSSNPDVTYMRYVTGMSFGSMALFLDGMWQASMVVTSSRCSLFRVPVKIMIRFLANNLDNFRKPVKRKPGKLERGGAGTKNLHAKGHGKGKSTHDVFDVGEVETMLKGKLADTDMQLDQPYIETLFVVAKDRFQRLKMAKLAADHDMSRHSLLNFHDKQLRIPSKSALFLMSDEVQVSNTKLLASLSEQVHQLTLSNKRIYDKMNEMMMKDHKHRKNMRSRTNTDQTSMGMHGNNNGEEVLYSHGMTSKDFESLASLYREQEDRQDRSSGQRDRQNSLNSQDSLSSVSSLPTSASLSARVLPPPIAENDVPAWARALNAAAAEQSHPTPSASPPVSSPRSASPAPPAAATTAEEGGGVIAAENVVLSDLGEGVIGRDTAQKTAEEDAEEEEREERDYDTFALPPRVERRSMIDTLNDMADRVERMQGGLSTVNEYDEMDEDEIEAMLQRELKELKKRRSTRHSKIQKNRAASGLVVNTAAPPTTSKASSAAVSAAVDGGIPTTTSCIELATEATTAESTALLSSSSSSAEADASTAPAALATSPEKEKERKKTVSFHIPTSGVENNQLRNFADRAAPGGELRESDGEEDEEDYDLYPEDEDDILHRF